HARFATLTGPRGECSIERRSERTTPGEARELGGEQAVARREPTPCQRGEGADHSAASAQLTGDELERDGKLGGAPMRCEVPREIQPDRTTDEHGDHCR